LRLDLEQPRAIANCRARDLLEPVEIVGPCRARNAIECIEIGAAVQRLVPRAERERGIPELRPRERLRRAQLMHARDRSPDAGIAGCGAVDDLDASDAFAFKAVGDRQAALAPADDDDVVVGAGSRPHPVGRVAPDPAQRVLRLRFEPLCGISTNRRRDGLPFGLRELGCSADAANGQCGCAAKESTPVHLARHSVSTKFVFLFRSIAHVFP
jgi:hypothetical protein